MITIDPDARETLLEFHRGRWAEFMSANRLVALEVVREPVLVDEDSQTLTVTAFVLDEHGHKQLTEDRQAIAKERRTVPLLSHPREHGLVAA